LGAGSFKFAGRVTPAGVDDVFALTGVGRFDATWPDAARFSASDAMRVGGPTDPYYTSLRRPDAYLCRRLEISVW
jgi:hypothetical protein